MSIKGNSGSEPELLQKAAVQGKTSAWAGTQELFLVPKTSSTVGPTPPTGNGAIFRLSSQFVAQDEGLGGFSCSMSGAWGFYESAPVEPGGANSWDAVGEWE